MIELKFIYYEKGFVLKYINDMEELSLVVSEVLEENGRFTNFTVNGEKYHIGYTIGNGYYYWKSEDAS